MSGFIHYKMFLIFCVSLPNEKQISKKKKEKLGKINYGHLYHVGCIKEWNKLENTCFV
ncbi:hypothetical protein RND71_032282 [Anisodus tanguticus]|uniref:Uncharacterized protein n=1 Tax=Anisodus tanguticus TaxID=243964 RepID=A0AAE1REX6_9SOLA|nr:hypothetical protein RND71_032282 [Anisodus tanguticus]